MYNTSFILKSLLPYKTYASCIKQLRCNTRISFRIDAMLILLIAVKEDKYGMTARGVC
jgi:hypothetical protein